MQPKATFPPQPEPVTRTVLDTHFCGGGIFLEVAKAWLESPEPSGVLHYVALCPEDELLQWRTSIPAQLPPDHPPTAPLKQELHGACASALPGMQRLLLAGGRISLTLCAGPLQAMLSGQLFQADKVHIALESGDGATLDLWDKWAVQSLARRCRRGTIINWHIDEVTRSLPSWAALRDLFIAQGFEWEPGCIYNPRWEIRTTRPTQHAHRIHSSPATRPQRCAVVGSGLAGASVAQAIALRGWHVTVLDALAKPAGGASGLPVGLVVPHVSVDDSPRSRMSRAGVRLMLQHAQALLQGSNDWNKNGVLEFTPDAERCLAASVALTSAGWLAEAPSNAQGLWHPHAGWIQPARLIESWLKQPGIKSLYSAPVRQLQREAGVWHLRNDEGKTVAEAELVVVANAMGALQLLKGLPAPWTASPDVLAKLQAMQAWHGTVNHGPMPVLGTAHLPTHAVNGNGSLVAHVPTQQGLQWFAGATYEADSERLADHPAQDDANWNRLNTLLPVAAQLLQPQFQAPGMGRWSGTRCVSHDRLPLVGPIDAEGASGVWLSIAMGSRGLSFAALCAELLVARIGNEPLPIDAKLARSLDCHRTRRTTLKP